MQRSAAVLMTAALLKGCRYLQYLLNMLLNKLAELISHSFTQTLNKLKHHTVQTMLLIHLGSFHSTVREGAAALLLTLLFAPHGQLSVEADLLLNVNVPVSMPTVLPLQAV